MLQQICYSRVVMINKGDVMNSISKTILLSAVSLFVDNGNLTYASEQIPLSVPKSGIQTLHTHHTHIRHTLQRLDLSSRLFDDLRISKGGQKVAKVCFITDTGECAHDKFGNLETPDGGIPDDHGTPKELCEKAGYPLTGSCPTLQVPNRRCPYDSNYYDKCVCQSGLVSCPSPQIGVGPSCGGKYQSCQCPSNYKSCDCGPAVGASSCTINGKTTYSDCKACCDDTCASGYSKAKPSGCYDTSRTECGNTCYKAKNCCDDTCPSGYSKAKPSGCYDTSRTECGNTCYKAKNCCDDTCPSGYSKTKSSECYDTKTTGCGTTCYKSKACCDDTCASGYSKTKPSGCYDTKTTGCGNTCYKSKSCAPQWGTCTGLVQNCSIGDILNSDGTCSTSKVSGKTPIGVVVYKSGNCGEALALEDVGRDVWSRNSNTIPNLTYYKNITDAVNDFNSCGNTNTIVSTLYSQTYYPSAYLAANYSTTGTKAGDWCLPAYGILNSYAQNQAIVDAGFNKAGSSVPSLYAVWSSTASSEAWAWGFIVKEGYNSNATTANKFNIVPSIKF